MLTTRQGGWVPNAYIIISRWHCTVGEKNPRDGMNNPGIPVSRAKDDCELFKSAIGLFPVRHHVIVLNVMHMRWPTRKTISRSTLTVQHGIIVEAFSCTAQHLDSNLILIEPFSCTAQHLKGFETLTLLLARLRSPRTSRPTNERNFTLHKTPHHYEQVFIFILQNGDFRMLSHADDGQIR